MLQMQQHAVSLNSLHLLRVCRPMPRRSTIVQFFSAKLTQRDELEGSSANLGRAGKAKRPLLVGSGLLCCYRVLRLCSRDLPLGKALTQVTSTEQRLLCKRVLTQ